MGFVILKESVSHAQVLPDVNTQYHSRIGCFLQTALGSSSCSKFSLCEVNDPCLFPVLFFYQQHTGTTQFHIIGVYAKSE